MFTIGEIEEVIKPTEKIISQTNISQQIDGLIETVQGLAEYIISKESPVPIRAASVQASNENQTSDTLDKIRAGLNKIETATIYFEEQ